MTQLSIGITAHSEGIILHKTLLSIDEACKHLRKARLSFEVLLQLDNVTPETLDYSTRIATLFPQLNLVVFESTYGNPGQARNNIVHQASGQYITFIDGDDLMSSNWLHDALVLLKNHEAGNETYVAHPEAVLEFDAENAIITRHGEIDTASDSLLSVYANRWNVVLMLPRKFLVENPYPYGKGYGYEDWYINCLTIYNNFHNVLVPRTALFVRRKKNDSVWATHAQSAAVLPRNPLLGFAHIRSLANPFATRETPGRKTVLKNKVKPYIKRVPVAYRAVHISKKVLRTLHTLSPTSTLPNWIQDEYIRMHTLDKSIFLTVTPTSYDSITPEHYQAAISYKAIADSLRYDTYDYVLFVPWLIKGGADLFSINYANAFARQDESKHVLVIATTSAHSPWKNKLDQSIDFLDFGTITRGNHHNVIQRLLEQLIENSGAQFLHIINSELAYSFVETHSEYIQGTGKKILATSFSQSIDERGRTFGYSHTHVPAIYNLLNVVTTDNQAVRDMWTREYGFDDSNILIHNQPVTVPLFTKKPATLPLRVLWAARLSPEKQPHLVLKIAKLLETSPIEIHMFGQPDENFNTSFLDNLPKNVIYHGSFDGFATLRPETYDTYLYTSLFDGMPNSILEAASYKLAIVSSAVGGIPELIDTQQGGILVDDIQNAQPYADALQYLASNLDQVNTFGENIQSKIKTEFSEDSYSAAIQEMLKKIGYTNVKKS